MRQRQSRAERLGFDLVELLGADGFLLHTFLSPISNRRTGSYGGGLGNRMRYPLEVAAAIREVWPRHKALGMRITGADWIDGGNPPLRAGEGLEGAAPGRRTGRTFFDFVVNERAARLALNRGLALRQYISGDPEQEYFVDCMVEEIITALSRIRWLFVLAHNSSFTYKGQAVDVKRVDRELGVRYVLEGSVRRSGSRVNELVRKVSFYCQ